jgi:hypothetical protein
MFHIRAGLDETELTSGLGITWRGYSFDYAFAYHDAWSDYDNLGISHRFGFTTRFGNKASGAPPDLSWFRTGESRYFMLKIQGSRRGSFSCPLSNREQIRTGKPVPTTSLVLL